MDYHIVNTTTRFQDVLNEKYNVLPPIWGYNDGALLSLQKATERLVETLPHIRSFVNAALHRSAEPQDGLSVDEIAAICLYTMEATPYTSSIYYHLNKHLREEERGNLIPWFPYLKLFMTGLDRIPSMETTVYRGVHLKNLADRQKYREGKEVIWWGFSSCTLDRKTAEKESYMGNDGKGVLFVIKCTDGKPIEKYSCYKNEKEVLLPPGTMFKVIKCQKLPNGTEEIELEQIELSDPLIQPVSHRSSQANSNSLSSLEQPTTTTTTASRSNVRRNPQLSAFLETIDNRSELRLPNLHIYDQDMTIIARRLLEKKQRYSMSFRENKLTPMGIQELSQVLQNSDYLEKLYISSNSLRTNGTEILCKALSARKTGALTLLCLSNNKLRDEGATHVATMLANYVTLTDLYLSENEITDDGFQKIISTLITKNRTLKLLTLSWNKFGSDPKSIKMLTDLIEVNGVLKEIDVTNCKIPSKSIKELRNLAESKNTLKLLL